MAIFDGRRAALQRISQSRWRDDAEKHALLAELRAEGPRAADLSPLLAHDDAAVREVAGELFAAGATVASALSLARDLRDQASSARSHILRAIARLPVSLVTQVVDQLLADRAPKTQSLGWEVALSLTGAEGARYLERAVTRGPMGMRGAALRRLLQAAPVEQIIDTLVEAARGDDVRLSSVAVTALAEVDDPRVTALMLEQFGSPDAGVREQASAWLGRAVRRSPESVRRQMLQLLVEGEDTTSRQCVEVLLQSGPPLEVLTDILAAISGLLGWLRTRIIQTLHTFGDQLAEAAITLLRHPNEDLRSTALMIAERFRDPRLVGPMCRMLRSEDWWLKVTACDTLAELRDPRAVPYLIGALKDEDCAWAAIEALGRIGAPEATNPVAHMLRDARVELRLEAIGALARFPERRVFTLLAAVKAEDPSTEVRMRAAEVLRTLAEGTAVDVGDVEAGVVAVKARDLKQPMDRLLLHLRGAGGSDLHVSAGEPPIMRIGGELHRVEHDVLEPRHTQALITSVLGERQHAVLEETGEVDFCYSVPGVGRFRANAFKQRLGCSATFRAIPNIPPTFHDLRLPGQLAELLDYHQGIIVVSGAASCGKSTTVAAMVNLINETKPVHVLTLEEPIEFVHPVKTALVNQREVGKHSRSYARALRGALREDPDVIMVGELRDQESIRLALEAAETGHLVLTTMHTSRATQTVDRLISGFPPEEQPQVRMALSDALKFVVCQQLIPREGGGRVAVFEILRGTFSVAALIREGKTYQLDSLMQIGRSFGMQTVDMALLELVESKIISPETAWLRARNQDNFAPLCGSEFLEQQRVVEEVVVP